METTLKITGMTCGHCVAAVERELKTVDGVTGVEVELNTEGESTAKVTTNTEVPQQALVDAVDEAGYDVV